MLSPCQRARALSVGDGAVGSIYPPAVIVHLNGELVPAEQARVSVFDRGFLFGDGIYEGLRAVSLPAEGQSPARRRVIGMHRHVRRMQQGLDAVGIAWDASSLPRMTDDLLDANGLRDAFVYWQVTRGTPPAGAPVRSRVPVPGTRPTVMGYCTPLPELPRAGLWAGGRDAPVPATKAASVQADLRWLRGQVKSISLLGNLLASVAAAERGGEEAILVRDGLLTEGSYTNVFIVTPAGPGERGRVVTPSLESAPILAGVTRDILIDLDPAIEQRAVRAAELESASEVILVGTTTLVTSVPSLDGRRVGTGEPGPHARRLLGLLLDAIAHGRDDLAAPVARAC